MDIVNPMVKEERNCVRHGVTIHTQSKWQWGFVCGKCNSERVQRNRRKQKVLLIEELGGKCILCGYSKCLWALEFHHVDPSTKEFGIGSNTCSRSIARMRKEAEKCVLLCANCHREVESGITILSSITAVRRSVKA